MKDSLCRCGHHKSEHGHRPGYRDGCSATINGIDASDGVCECRVFRDLPKGDMATRWTEACGVTGDVSCMDCIEGQCLGSRQPVKVQVTECDCGGHNVYGEMHHYEDCPRYVPESVS